MTGNPGYPAQPTSHLRLALPPHALILAPAPPEFVPMRPPAQMWGLVVVAARTSSTTARVRVVPDMPYATRIDTAALFAGVWLPEPPPPDLHTGDVVVRLHPPADSHGQDPDRVDIEVLAATTGTWSTVGRWWQVDRRWPQQIAVAVVTLMHCLADAELTDAYWATLTGPLAAALPEASLATELDRHSRGLDGARWSSRPALAALIGAGLLSVGEKLVCNGHTATVREGGLLHEGGSPEFAVSTVTALATSLIGDTVNGWHLWHRARDQRLLAELRTELGTP
jgi:hypothetical protein